VRLSQAGAAGGGALGIGAIFGRAAVAAQIARAAMTSTT
jgi:hypothetical protein